jgi:hypothetical protein
MSANTDTKKGKPSRITTASDCPVQRWEIIFFIIVYSLLCLQVFYYYIDIGPLSSIHRAIAIFASFDSFILTHISRITIPVFVPTLADLLTCRVRPHWCRRYLDIIGTYVIIRMAIQLLGLNILVFDAVSSRFTLITQLLLFLPYSLLIWGWIYWRLDMAGRAGERHFFRLDLEGKTPRPIDYFVASFSSVFSASISAIKGNSARARILILAHGFLIYDVMGLTLTRAVSLVQGR